MNRNRVGMALLIPFVTVLVILGYAGGLGVIFILLNESALGEWGVIVLGVLLVVGVPGVAALVQQRVERR